MSAEAVKQATADFQAYIETLDLAETLGELRHVTQFHGYVLGHERTPGFSDRMAAIGLGMLTYRLLKLLADTTLPTEPPHVDDDTVHSCVLLGRMAIASVTP